MILLLLNAATQPRNEFTGAFLITERALSLYGSIVLKMRKRGSRIPVLSGKVFYLVRHLKSFYRSVSSRVAPLPCFRLP